jgi:hypothetical protein
MFDPHDAAAGGQSGGTRRSAAKLPARLLAEALRGRVHPTSIRRDFASSAFGRTRVITPSRISAFILS